MAKKKPKQVKRLLLNDSQCRCVLRELRRFGYPNMQLSSVEASAERVSKGLEKSNSLVDAFVLRFVCEMEEAIK